MNIRTNENFANIKPTYLFSEIGARVRAYEEANPEAKVIRMGIGDVTLPLPAIVVDAMVKATQEMGVKETFRGYPPEYGYGFLRDAISIHYANLGVSVDPESVFVSDGAKSDLGNIVDILGTNQVIIPDPVYPVYVDSNIMSGNHIIYVKGTKENGFLPLLSELKGENIGSVIYLCSPNNPTGAAYDKTGLKAWVDYALETGSLIIYDSAYEAFISDENIPHTIYEIPGSYECAIEICSFSKFAGFTGVRCGWTVIPDTLRAGSVNIAALWRRRQATKFNGVSYPVQRAAEAALSDEGIKACRVNIDYYKNNAALLSELLDEKGIFYTGGKNSPYVWMECPEGFGSWEFFDKLLNEVQIVGTPGEGFGKGGDRYFRITAFGSYENTKEAVERLKGIL
ncbi:MAG: LL-diaminopimelate aminotransferase [Clostridiales bacterium]|nr:LL-diaminopimelate aminotransferase [Clostridiales bacterium]